MKKTLLIGLAAVALGSMTACSNILEEEGVISPSAKIGLLNIGLDTDNALNIVTKATENVDFSGVNKNNFAITVTPATGTTIPEGTTLPTTTGTHKVPVGTYNLSATYGNTTQSLAWDNPCFAGSTTSGVVVAANGVPADGTILCDLTNSIIDIVDASFANLGTRGITVNYVSVVMSDNDNIGKDTDLSSLTHYYFYHHESQTSLKTNYLYAKSTLTNVKVIIDGYVTADNTKRFRGVAPIATNGTIGADNKYNVTFDLNEDNGFLSLAITVNNEVTIRPIEVPVNPY